MCRTLRLACVAAFALVALSATAHAKTCPNIVIALDKSPSMNDDPNGGQTHPSKWELAQQAVINLVNMYGDRVPFGLVMFESDAFHSDAQCLMDAMVQVPPAHETAVDIVQMVKAAMPPTSGHTNTGEAVHQAAALPQMMDTTRLDVIVLITDGSPSCNSIDLEMVGMGGTPDYTIGEINNARNQMPSIHTWVIGFDGDAMGIDMDALSAMAQAGGEPYGSHMGEPMCGNMIPCYYSANDATKLTAALANIIDQSGGGEFGGVMCDDSCYSNGCQQGYVCEKGELDPVAKCVPNFCAGVMCSGGQFCRGDDNGMGMVVGHCVGACTDGCAASQKCVNGNCVADPCYGVNCGAGMACTPSNGQCAPDLCMGRTCSGPTKCNPITGKCEDDQCDLIQCPSGTTCSDGNCAAKNTSGRGKGCSVTDAPSSPLAGGLAIALLFLALVAFVARTRLRV
jgi:hypothetical protein